LRDLLRADGLTVPGAGSNLKSHPATRLLESTRNQASRMLGDFGLTPRGRLGVEIRPTSAVAAVGASNEDKYLQTKPWERQS